MTNKIEDLFDRLETVKETVFEDLIRDVTVGHMITELEELIKARDEDKVWQEMKQEEMNDTNGYFWFRCGERTFYKGMVEGMTRLGKQLGLIDE